MFSNIRLKHTSGGVYVTGFHPSFGDTTIYVFRNMSGRKVWSHMSGNNSQWLYHHLVRHKVLSKMLDSRV